MFDETPEGQTHFDPKAEALARNVEKIITAFDKEFM